MYTDVVTFATEPELKTVMVGETERSVMNGRVAIKQGKDHASFINVTAWGKLAEYIGTYYKKGDEIYIEGDIRNSNYTVGDRTLQTNYIHINTVKATFGQKSRRFAADVESDYIPETDTADMPKPTRRRRLSADEVDDSE